MEIEKLQQEKKALSPLNDYCTINIFFLRPCTQSSPFLLIKLPDQNLETIDLKVSSANEVIISTIFEHDHIPQETLNLWLLKFGQSSDMKQTCLSVINESSILNHPPDLIMGAYFISQTSIKNESNKSEINKSESSQNVVKKIEEPQSLFTDSYLLKGVFFPSFWEFKNSLKRKSENYSDDTVLIFPKSPIIQDFALFSNTKNGNKALIFEISKFLIQKSFFIISRKWFNLTDMFFFITTVAEDSYLINFRIPFFINGNPQFDTNFFPKLGYRILESDKIQSIYINFSKSILNPYCFFTIHKIALDIWAFRTTFIAYHNNQAFKIELLEEDATYFWLLINEYDQNDPNNSKVESNNQYFHELVDMKDINE